MQKLAELLYVKDTTVFELVHHTFYERDFVYFGNLAIYLGNLLGYEERESLNFGRNSELLYLSSLLHFSFAEEPETAERLQSEKQMPVLLGDLLYGHFISYIAKGKQPANLSICIEYLKEFNANRIDSFEGRIVYTMDDAVKLLTEKTAEVMAVSCGKERSTVVSEATMFFQSNWNQVHGKKIAALEALEQLLKKEFGQGAMVC